MDYKLINEILKDLSNIAYDKNFKFVANEENNGNDMYSENITVYKYKDTDIFIKLTVRGDSYGENPYVHSVQFVKPVVKQVTDFESL